MVSPSLNHLSTRTPQEPLMSQAAKSSTFGLVALIGLNLVPLFGVFGAGWQSFDLIFLYWTENVVIGAFVLWKMALRPYRHPLDLVFPLLLAPFFALHYGAFCWGHGSLVMSLFGPGDLGRPGLVAAAGQTLAAWPMPMALGALVAVQAMNWGSDVMRRGFGVDDIRDLMVGPYRRIMVLHVTILAGGFALGALEEPVVGLVILVMVKTASDVWHLCHDREAQAETFTFTPKHLAEMQEKFPRPVITVNGKDVEYSSFRELAASSHYRMAEALFRLVGGAEELKAMKAYLELKIGEEDTGNGADLNAEQAASHESIY
jgi:hypothetical protein